MSTIKVIRIALLVLIIIGVGLLIAQKFWVSSLTGWILAHEQSK